MALNIRIAAALKSGEKATLGAMLSLVASALDAGAPLDSEITIVRRRSGGLSEVVVDWGDGAAADTAVRAAVLELDAAARQQESERSVREGSLLKPPGTKKTGE